MKSKIGFGLLLGAFFIGAISSSMFLKTQSTRTQAASHTVSFTFTNDDQVFALLTDDVNKVRAPRSSLDQPNGYDFLFRQNRVLSGWYFNPDFSNEVDFSTATFFNDTTLYATWLFSNPGSPQFGDIDPFEADLTTYGLETSIIDARSEAYITLDVWLASNEMILSYRWQTRKDDGTDTYQDIIGATSNRLDITQEGRYRYRCFYTYSLDGITTYELKSHAVTLIRAEDNPSFWWLLPVGVSLVLSGGLIYLLFFKKYALILHYREDQTMKLLLKANTPYEEIRLPILTKPGAVFLGWATDLEGKQRFDEPMMPRRDMHLYPIWQRTQKG